MPMTVMLTVSIYPFGFPSRLKPSPNPALFCHRSTRSPLSSETVSHCIHFRLHSLLRPRHSGSQPCPCSGPPWPRPCHKSNRPELLGMQQHQSPAPSGTTLDFEESTSCQLWGSRGCPLSESCGGLWTPQSMHPALTRDLFPALLLARLSLLLDSHSFHGSGHLHAVMQALQLHLWLIYLPTLIRCLKFNALHPKLASLAGICPSPPMVNPLPTSCLSQTVWPPAWAVVSLLAPHVLGHR